jgi:hypothetical protein
VTDSFGLLPQASSENEGLSPNPSSYRQLHLILSLLLFVVIELKTINRNLKLKIDDKQQAFTHVNSHDHMPQEETNHKQFSNQERDDFEIFLSKGRRGW